MNNLRKIRLLSGKTQAETAKIISATQNTYSNYELGKTQPDMDTLIVLADYFHTTIDALLGHDVPYLLDKSTLTEKQRTILELLPEMSDNVCERAEAYISGLIEGEREYEQTLQRFRK